MDQKIQYVAKLCSSMIEDKNWDELQVYLDNLNISEVESIIDELPEYETEIINTLSINRAINVFSILDSPTQNRIIEHLPKPKIAEIVKGLTPDDRTSFLEDIKDSDLLHQLIALLSPEDRKEAFMLLSYPEDSIGRLMTPDFLAIPKYITVREALDYIRTHGKDSETIDVVYIVDDKGVLLDDLRIKQILVSDLDVRIEDLMDQRLVYLNAYAPVSDGIQIFKMNNRVALPVIDSIGVLLGIVTIDDMLWVADEEFAEDMQRIGGTSVLEEPYLDLSIPQLVKKRAGWLVVLFLGELLTASVMQYFEGQLEKFIVLALFLPLMISSGGNSGSQASSLIIQAMATGEVKLKHWIKVFRREIISGTALGVILGGVGFLRIVIWHGIFPKLYGDHWILVGLTVAFALIGIVLWGSLVGSMLPFILKKLKQDPATSSAPFVATIVDVTGLIIYLTIAGWVFSGVVK